MHLHSIRNKLALLIMCAVLPCLAILVYSGIEQRQNLIKTAQADVLLLTHTMGEAQKSIVESTKQILSTLSRLPAIEDLNPSESTTLFKAMLDQNPNYDNMTLVDLAGTVIASGKPFTATNLADRKHVKEALGNNAFAAGEFIMTRVGASHPAFTFAYPVADTDNKPKAVLTVAIKLDVFSRFYDVTTLPKKSFLSITDHTGIRLFYYPAQTDTNPIGKPIQARSWDIARKGGPEGLFFSVGSDNQKRIFAYKKIYLKEGQTPYLYAWAGIPEDHILSPANAALTRNLLLLLLVTLASLVVSWIIGKNTLISPLQRLATLAHSYARGDLAARIDHPGQTGEIGVLTKALHDMADTLAQGRNTLEQSEQRFRTVADFAYDWEYWVGPDGHFVYLSTSCERITGYTSEEITADPQLVFKMVPPEYTEMVRTHYFEESQQNTPVFSTEFPIITKNGQKVWLEHNCSPVYDANGNYAGRRGNNRDITDRKRVEEEKNKMEKQYRQSQKMEAIGQLAGGVAHDFNNMLGVILGYTELALEELSPSQPLFKNLSEIHKAALRSADITRQLLAFARKQTVSPRVQNLNETVEGMLKMLRRLIGEDINLAWLPGAGLWPVKIDPSQIDQILANLCVNARDAIAGVGTMTVATKNITLDAQFCAAHPGSVRGEYVRITVSDSGCGIDEATLTHIFEPFFTTKGIGQGTGLGLSTVFGAVKQNNGFIDVSSEPGRGTSFSIYLPRHLGGDDQENGDEATRATETLGHETILLVEDEPTILSMARTMLERLGYTVLTAGSPEEAIRRSAGFSGEIHLLMTDVVMPGCNGRDLADRLLGASPGMKCLFMSGYTANIITNHGVLDEGVYFIQKPFSKKELASKIRQILET